MQEVKLIEQAVAQMNQRLIEIAREAYKERNEGLEADWTSIAEGLDTIKEKAEHASAMAWRVAYESAPDDQAEEDI